MSLVNMINDDEVIAVNNACVEAHERKGWKLTERKITAIEVVETEPTDYEKEELAKARAEYKELTDKKPHHSWSAEDIYSKLAELTQ